MTHCIFSRSPLAFLLVLLPLFTSLVSANTEIKNVHVGRRSTNQVSSADSSHVSAIRDLFQSHLQVYPYPINATHNEDTFRLRAAPLGTPLHAVCEGDVNHERTSGSPVPVERCLHELWLEVDFGCVEWMKFDWFTVRLSWPAFNPADFDIALYSPEELQTYFRARLGLSEDETKIQIPPPRRESVDADLRIMYSRIRLVDTGVRPPLRSKTSHDSSSSAETTSQTVVEVVPFNIIVEPLLLGVLPATLFEPIIQLFILLLTFAYLVLPYMMRYLESVAAKARKELDVVGGRERK